jgi:hypothetical protein
MEKNTERHLQKTDWSGVSEKVKALNPALYCILEKLNPSHEYAIYTVNYPYGDMLCKAGRLLIPNHDNVYVDLSDESIDPLTRDELGYARAGLPLGMVLDKTLESFINAPTRALPLKLYSAGSVFQTEEISTYQQAYSFKPHHGLNLSSGGRSVFLLPSIHCYIGFRRLNDYLGLQVEPPKTLNNHFELFQSILQSAHVASSWTSEVLYFSKSWLERMHSDPSWLLLKNYFLDQQMMQHQYDLGTHYYDLFYGHVQEKRNLKISQPYITETVIHLIKIALGLMPGFVPAVDNETLPLHLLQKVFVECYELKKHIPTIMQPAMHDFETANTPIYYSLQHPTMPSHHLKKASVSTAILDIKSISRAMGVFLEEMLNQSSMMSNTVFEKLATMIQVDYFHNTGADGQHILPITDLIAHDQRFEFMSSGIDGSELTSAIDGKFFRGCVSMG